MRVWHAIAGIVGSAALVALLNSGLLPFRGEAARVVIAIATVILLTCAVSTVAILIWSGSPRNRRAIGAVDSRVDTGEPRS